MKKSLLFSMGGFLSLIIMLLMVSCSTSKKLVGADEKVVNRPCTGKEYQSTTAIWRATGNGSSPRQDIAQRIAEQNARTQLTRQLSTKIFDAISSSNTQYQLDKTDEYSGKINSLSEGVAMGVLKGTKIVCDEMRQNTKTGEYISYVCIEFDPKTVVPSIISAVKQSIGKDDKLKIDFQEEQFRKKMESELEKFSNISN
ncbi:MAG: hypothetical protein ACRCR9_01210 [Chitinophagaceae bacterium]